MLLFLLNLKKKEKTQQPRVQAEVNIEHGWIQKKRKKRHNFVLQCSPAKLIINQP